MKVDAKSVFAYLQYSVIEIIMIIKSISITFCSLPKKEKKSEREISNRHNCRYSRYTLRWIFRAAAFFPFSIQSTCTTYCILVASSKNSFYSSVAVIKFSTWAWIACITIRNNKKKNATLYDNFFSTSIVCILTRSHTTAQ